MAPSAQKGSGCLSRGLLLLWGKCAGAAPGPRLPATGGTAPGTTAHTAALLCMGAGAGVLV